MKTIVFALMFCCTAVIACADSITLSSGKEIEGTIVEQTDEYIKIDNGVSPVTYYQDELVAINGQSIKSIQPVAEPAPVVEPIPAQVNDAFVQEVQSVNVVENTEPTVVTQPAIIQSTMSASDTSKQSRRTEVDTPSFVAFIVSAVVMCIIFYVVSVMPLAILSKRYVIAHPWMAWVPIVNLYLMCKLANRPGWWVILLFIPLLNLIFIIIIWMKIAQLCRKPAWVGILSILPFIGVFIPWYFALSKD